jgi:glutamine cyclotransferase
MRQLLLTVALAVTLATTAPAAGVENLDFEIVGKLPHSRKDFTQGLEIRDGILYQGTGLRGRSRLQGFDLKSGRLLRERALPRRYFGEGITVLGDRIVQLTWRSRKAFVYRRSDFQPIGEFTIPGEGWGLTNNGERLIYSDGSHILRFIDPETWEPAGSLAVHRNGTPLQHLNELEWTPDGLWANVWRRDLIVRIDTASGAVTGEINLRGLLPRAQILPGTDVLNGIAYDPADNTLWVTGKNWPWLYQLSLPAR